MARLEETEALVTHLEAVLKRLETGNTEFPGACTACLQDVANAGHMPSCILAGALGKIRMWRAGVNGALTGLGPSHGDYLPQRFSLT
jgi:hypothetical protein